MFRLNPQTAKKVRRFKAIKRGYYSFLAVAIVVIVTAFGELLVNSRALFVSYEGDWYFPTYTKFHPGTDFGLDYDYEVDYRALRAQWQEQGSALALRRAIEVEMALMMVLALVAGILTTSVTLP